jgi:transcriptional regulator with XRE-family HTH domain
MTPLTCETHNAARACPTELLQTGTPTTANLIKRAMALVPTQKALARRLRLSKGRISRIVHGGRLGFERCLRLADLIHEDPAVVLQAYRYPELSEILQSLYVTRGCVPRERARVHEALDRLPSDDHHAIGNLIERLVSAGRTEPPGAESRVGGLDDVKGGAR